MNLIDYCKSAKGIFLSNFHRSVKFSISGWISFGFVELLTYLLFHILKLSNLISVSASFLTGVAIEYLINEFWTTREAGIHSGSYSGILRRMVKFEFINLGGTALSISIQYVLFLTFKLDPLIGNLIGSAASFPINYYLQMKNTWGIDIL